MKKHLILFLIIVLGLQGKSQEWVQSFGPEGHALDKIVYMDDKIHVVKDEYKGLFISDDLGDSWNKGSFEEMKTEAVGFSLYEIDGSYFAYSISKLYKTDDKGKSWTLSNEGLVLPFHKPPVMSGFNDTLLICTEEEGVYRSVDGGANWKKAGKNSLKDRITVHAIEINGYIITAVEGEGIMVSQASNDNFILKQSFSGGEEAKSAATAYGKAWVATTENIYSSADNGNNWEKYETNFSTNSLVMLDDDLYSCCESGIYSVSDVGGFSQELDNGLETLSINDLIKVGDKYFAATSLGIIRSANKQNWGVANKDLGFTNIWDLAKIGDTYFMGSNIGLWKSGSYGQRWVPASFPGKKIYSLSVSGDSLFAALENPNDSITTIYMSENKGNSWTQLGQSLPVTLEPKLKVAAGNLYCHIPKDWSINSGIYKLSSFSGDWENVATSDGNAFNICNDKIYNGHLRGDLQAENWVTLTGDVESVRFHEFVVGPNGSDIIAGCQIMQPGDVACYSSSDGLHFNKLSNGLETHTGAMIDMVTKGDTTYAVADVGMNKTFSYFIVKGQTSWTKLGGNSLNEMADDGSLYPGDQAKMMVTPYSVFLSSSRGEGLFRYDFETLPEVPDTVDQIEYPPLSMQDDIKNNQGTLKIFPNPASGMVSVQAEQPIQQITLYNLRGGIQKRLNIGQKDIDLDISRLTPGIYILQSIDNNGKISTAKVVKE